MQNQMPIVQAQIELSKPTNLRELDLDRVECDTLALVNGNSPGETKGQLKPAKLGSF